MMNIRKAKQTEASKVAPLLLLAMEDIFFEFIGIKSAERATAFLSHLVALPGNQYSYEHCWVAQKEQQIVGVACVYDGAKLSVLRAPVAREINIEFNRPFYPEAETMEGEIYIDSVGVNPLYQGQGVGSGLFRFLINEYVEKQQQVLGLLVDYDNPNAKRLYLQLGFKMVGEKILAGKRLAHMQLEA